MQETIEILNFILALGGVALFLGVLLLTFDFLSKNRTLVVLIEKFALIGAFFLATTSVIMTLVYSEIFGFVPCGLCWLQRICLYPQALMLALAAYTKDRAFLKYGILLSIPGVIVSLYQHYLQMGGAELVTCPSVGGAADCAERILFEFGFMTFPLMSAALFLFLIALYSYLLLITKKTS
jgi:disulfide bond formation protein DsbB